MSDLIDDSAGSAAVLRVVIVGEDFEFLDGVRIGTHDDVVTEEIGVIPSVEQKRQRFGALPANGKRISRGIVGIRTKNASLEQAELQSVAAAKREIVDHALIFDFSEDGAGGVHLDYV